MQRPNQRVIDALRIPYIQNYINEGKFELLYDILTNGEFSPLRSGRDISQLTQLLLASGIDPLKDTTKIPAYYLCTADIESAAVPEHIKEISMAAFSDCANLKSIDVHNVTSIDSTAFMNCYNLKKIICSHTKDKAITYYRIHTKQCPFSSDTSIICVDGILRI